MKELDPHRLSRICNAVQEGLSVLLEYLQTEGIADWHQRYTLIQQELRLGNYEEVVAMVKTNHRISHDEADRMDLLCHYLGTPPREESKRLEQGHKRYGKYYKALMYSVQLWRATDALRVYTAYRIFNEPIAIQK
jgi:hypothetical protein